MYSLPNLISKIRLKCKQTFYSMAISFFLKKTHTFHLSLNPKKLLKLVKVSQICPKIPKMLTIICTQMLQSPKYCKKIPPQFLYFCSFCYVVTWLVLGKLRYADVTNGLSKSQSSAVPKWIGLSYLSFKEVFDCDPPWSF